MDIRGQIVGGSDMVYSVACGALCAVQDLVQCAVSVYSAQFTVLSIHCVVYSALYAVQSVHCRIESHTWWCSAA